MRRTTYGVIAVVALAVLAHLAVGGLLVTVAGPWKHWVIGLVLAGAVIHIALRARHKSRGRLVSLADSPRSGGTHEH